MADLAEGQVYIASDVHWRPAQAGDPEPTGLFGRFLAELAARARSGVPCELYILGDLFDYWLERSGQTFPFYDVHLAALSDASEAGVRIAVLFGNRDFTYGELLPKRCGVRVLGDRASLTLGAKRVALQHGDLLCTRDWRYQIFRRLIRSWPVRWLMRLVSLERMTRWIARMRQASRAEIARKPAAAMGIVDRAVARELGRGHDVVICGHVHQPERRTIAAAGELISLGAWDREAGWYVVCGNDRLQLRRYG